MNIESGKRCVVALAIGFGFARGARGADVWDWRDFANPQFNQLLHGGRQVHELQPDATNPDVDYLQVATRTGRSYEVRISGMNTSHLPTCTACLKMHRTTSVGGILQTAVHPDDLNGGYTGSQVLRWIAGADAHEFVRLTAMQAAPSPGEVGMYEIEFFDTTYFAPRFNQSGGQTTVLLIQDASRDTRANGVTGTIHFYGASGVLLATAPLSVPENGVQVLNCGTIAALSGLSGAVTIAHTGGYGALVAKAVAVEPSTGFTFDTAFQPMPH